MLFRSLWCAETIGLSVDEAELSATEGGLHADAFATKRQQEPPEHDVTNGDEYQDAEQCPLWIRPNNRVFEGEAHADTIGQTLGVREQLVEDGQWELFRGCGQ